ncbi:MAG: KilA-N domain-containing protein [Micrococcaceae bacterium]
MTSKSGRYGGTFAHPDIAFEFASWISAEFKLYIIKDYKRLKQDESNRLSLNWNLNRELAKINYKVHTEAVKNNLVTKELTKSQIAFTYASEADVLNVALFGKTAQQWHDENKSKTGNIWDYATLNQLVVLVNLENYNATLIQANVPQPKRLELLNQQAIQQLKIFEKTNLESLRKLGQKAKVIS